MILEVYKVVGFTLFVILFSVVAKSSGNLVENGINVCSRTVSFTESYQQSYQVSNKHRTTVKCGMWGWERCTQYRIVYRIQYRTATRTSYRKQLYCCQGWSQVGDQCTKAICTQPCVNGTCTKPDYCSCYSGYHGKLCDTATAKPTTKPTPEPSTKPRTTKPTTTKPTAEPSTKPTTTKPTAEPSTKPTTTKPTAEPSTKPATIKPTAEPSTKPTTTKPTAEPSTKPTTEPTVPKPLGCFLDGHPRGLPELIASFRNTDIFDWNNLNKTINACAQLVMFNRYKVFGIQFYGECWSGNSTVTQYDMYGPASPDSCYKGVGGPGVNFVYQLTST